MAPGGDVTDGPGARAGRLKVFLGAAPGVGKTYRMLDEGRRRARRGNDVGWGLRSATADRPPRRCSKGSKYFPAVPRILAEAPSASWISTWSSRRRPEVVLVDELAHTNVPGGRNAKRWQDIEELLAAGIDVVTTSTSSTWSR